MSDNVQQQRAKKIKICITSLYITKEIYLNRKSMEIDSHIEGIIADTALTEAYKYKRRSKKWRKLIKIPHISQCEEIVATYTSKDYEFIVQKHPIGRELFTLFCLKTSP